MASAEDAFDDDFADLLNEDLEELERKAYCSTQPLQNSTQSHAAVPVQTYGNEIDTFQEPQDDGGDVVIVESNGDTNANHNLRRYENEARLAVTNKTPSKYLPYRLSSQNYEAAGFEEEAGPRNEHGVHMLQVQVQELLLEREKLQSAVSDATREIFSKSGEISIVRANNERALRERERKIADLERELKVANEQRAAEQEQARKHQEQLATENRFADHDRVVAQTRQRKQTSRQESDVVIKPSKSKAQATKRTPKKSRQIVAGDGFDEQERSPLRQSTQSPHTTPTALDRKRKRILESPSKVQSFATDYDNDTSMQFDEGITNFNNTSFDSGDRSANDSRYHALQAFLDHKYDWKSRRTIEILAEYSYPSYDENTSLSSLVYDAIAKIDRSLPENDFNINLCSIDIDIWRKCISEKYYAPLPFLMDHISFLLDEFPDVLPTLMDDLVPLLQTTGDINIVPRFKRHRRGASSNNAELPTFVKELSASVSLNILFQIVSSFDTRDSLNVRWFWRLMRFDFISMLLRSSQEPADIALMGTILGYSAHADCVGSVIDPQRTRPSQDQANFDQTKSEEHLLDRISSMLVELPKSVEDEPEEYAEVSVCKMRLALLGCLASYANRLYTANCAARHPLVVGRLVRCMADGYHCAMQASPNDEELVRLHVQVVSEATRLVYYFLNSNLSVDIHAKLAKIPGGPQKYLIALSRLVFSEGSLYGVEIEEGVLDCAQSLLEDFVSPEEGEMLMEMAGGEQ